MQIRNIFIATNVKCTNDNRLILHTKCYFLICSKLLIFAWKLGSVHEKKFGTEKANTFGIMLNSSVGVIGITNIGNQENLITIACDCIFTAIRFQRGFFACKHRCFGTIFCKFSIAGVINNASTRSINDYHITCFNGFCNIFDRKNCRNFQSTRNNRRVRSTTASFGNDTCYVFLIDIGCHRRCKLVHNYNRVLRQARQINDFFTKQVCQNTSFNIGNIGCALTEQLIFHI